MIFKYFTDHVPRYISDIVLSIMILGYLVIGWHWLQTAQPELEPGQGKTEIITNTNVHPGEPIELFIKTTVDQSMCKVLSERHIFDSNGNKILSKYVIIPHEALLKLQTTGVRLKVELPVLAPGTYYYISTIHLSCPGGTSYVRTTNYLSFQVIP